MVSYWIFYLLILEQYLCVIKIICDIIDGKKNVIYLYKDFKYWVHSGNLHALMIFGDCTVEDKCLRKLWIIFKLKMNELNKCCLIYSKACPQ